MEEEEEEEEEEEGACPVNVTHESPRLVRTGWRLLACRFHEHSTTPIVIPSLQPPWFTLDCDLRFRQSSNVTHRSHHARLDS